MVTFNSKGSDPFEFRFLFRKRDVQDKCSLDGAKRHQGFQGLTFNKN